MGAINYTKFIFLLIPCIVLGQSEQEQVAYYNWFDTVIGHENTGLYDGFQYVNRDVGRIQDNKHAFFTTDEVLVGSVVYNDQPYYDVSMKYNLETDKLIVTSNDNSSWTFVLQLSSDKIKEFTIDNRRFINRDVPVSNTSVESGFYEVLVEGTNFIFLKKHKKTRKKILKDTQDGRLFYEFLDKNKYLLFANESYSNIKTKRDIIKIYPSLKKEIKQFYGNHYRLKKQQPDTFMQKLFKEVIEQLVSKTEV